MQCQQQARHSLLVIWSAQPDIHLRQIGTVESLVRHFCMHPREKSVREVNDSYRVCGFVNYMLLIVCRQGELW